MTTIKEDITALRAFIAPYLPTTTQYHLQNEPKEPAAGMLVVRYANQSPAKRLTATHTQVERFYQFIYYGKTNIDVIDTADILRRAISNQIKLKVGADHITVGAFVVLPATKADNGTDAIVCTFTVETTEAQALPTYPKVTSVSATIESN